MSHYREAISHSINNLVKTELDLSNYATKSDV